MIGPILAGLVGTLLPSFGYFPALGATMLSLDPWAALFAWPGIGRGIGLAVWVGIASTLISVLVVVLFLAASDGSRWLQAARRLVSPLLSIPHATMAIGLAFLISPSGWMMRLFSPWATGFERPPDWLIVHDPWAISLIAGLVIKEVPFLFLMALAGLGQMDGGRTTRVSASLGYAPFVGWMKAVLPVLYPSLRLPILAVIAYAGSVVDMAMILGPTTPPTLAVTLTQWFADPDLDRRLVASAGALLQLVLIAGMMGTWLMGEAVVSMAGRSWIRAGSRRGGSRLGQVLGYGAMSTVSLAGVAAITIIVLWAVTKVWRYPAPLPTRLDPGRMLDAVGTLLPIVVNSVVIPLVGALTALVLTIGCLEAEARRGGLGERRRRRRATLLLYVPMLLPQVAFLFGIQVLLIGLGLDGGMTSVIWMHVVFSLPFIFLSMAEPFRRLDPRYERAALSLGCTPDRVLLRVKLPMLLRPILVALAVGFAVGVGLYLPTLIAGAGRVETLTTLAVGLSAGGDRRMLAVVGLLQMALPLVAFVLAVAVPSWVFRHRRGLRLS